MASKAYFNIFNLFVDLKTELVDEGTFSSATRKARFFIVLGDG
jgi:hypothetical protein